MTMIEKVARALQKTDGQSGTCYELTDLEAIAFARAAIEAMREPTGGMLAAAHGMDRRLDTNLGRECALYLHSAMIDAALAEVA